MREAHRDVFFHAAEQYTCWIGLREPNPLSDPWIGVRGYLPKDLDCKAKTADNPGHRHSGLVTNPLMCPEAFTRKSLPDAEAMWKEKFLVQGELPAGFSCVAEGPDAGLVMQHGAFLYADFDLMALCRSNERAEVLATTLEEQRDLFELVANAVNTELGIPLIQHGAEFMWTEGVGARASELVFWFGPKRAFRCCPSSMPRAGH